MLVARAGLVNHDEGILKSKLKGCLGGLLNTVKQGFSSASTQLYAGSEEQSIELTMYPFKTVNVQAQKYQVKKNVENSI